MQLEKEEIRMYKIESLFKERFYYQDNIGVIYNDFWDCPWDRYCEVKKK
jgi:hypothetical protein